MTLYAENRNYIFFVSTQDCSDKCSSNILNIKMKIINVLIEEWKILSFI